MAHQQLMALAILSTENNAASALDYAEMLGSYISRKAERDIFRVGKNLIYTY
jgi:hypothetical protein